MKNIYLISTDKPSKLFKDDFNKYFISINIDQEQNHFKPQHIYITSDEEIKEEDWVYHKLLKSIFKINLKEVSQEYIEERKNILKTILTTDLDLIKDGVQAIDDKFLEWFVKNPSCEFVNLENHVLEVGYNLYKIIIPNKEPQTQNIVNETIKIVSEDVNLPKCVRDGLVKKESRKNRLLEELIEDIKCKQSFLKSIRKNPQLYYYKLGNCIYERLYDNDNCFEMQDPYGGRTSKMEKELINLKAEKIYYE
jgi:hypothetical protein